jgi:hypothetical protein
VLIVGGLLAMAVGAIGATGRVRRVVAERQQALALGEQLMTEIMQCYFQDPAGGTQNGRANFNDVDDYDKYSDSPPTDKAGAALAGCTGWSRTVRVDTVRETDPTQKNGGTTLKRIAVTVTAPSGRTWTMYGLRAKSGAYELAPAATTNYLTYAGVELQVGTNTTTVRRTAHPLNITTSQ